MLVQDRRALIDECVKLTDIVDREVMHIYQKHQIPCQAKEDCSPLTEADLASHHLIVPALEKLTPDIPVISEEGEIVSLAERFWLVDPLDGTKEFISKNGEFTVNIALIEKGRPVLGVVSAPALGTTYWGGFDCGAMRKSASGLQAIFVCTNDGAPKIIGSRSHGTDALDAWVAKNYPDAGFCSVGSSLKFCMIAEGQAHLYPRFGRTMEWDTAAGHAVLASAGGAVRDLNGNELAYGKAGFENPHFIATNQ